MTVKYYLVAGAWSQYDEERKSKKEEKAKEDAISSYATKKEAEGRENSTTSKVILKLSNLEFM